MVSRDARMCQCCCDARRNAHRGPFDAAHAANHNHGKRQHDDFDAHTRHHRWSMVMVIGKIASGGIHDSTALNIELLSCFDYSTSQF